MNPDTVLDAVARMAKDGAPETPPSARWSKLEASCAPAQTERTSSQLQQERGRLRSQPDAAVLAEANKTGRLPKEYVNANETTPDGRRGSMFPLRRSGGGSQFEGEL